MRIVIVGGTGRIGARLAGRLAGEDVVVAAPSTGVDAVRGTGLEAALAGADAVVDVMRPRTYAPDQVQDFFATSTRTLLRASRDAGVRHYVALTIVGTAEADIAFYRAKAAQEVLVRESALAYSLVHATQFFEFAGDIADSATVDGVVRLPGALVQPIAADDVAAELAGVVLGARAGGDTEIAGPERMPMDDFVRRVLAASGDPRPVERVDAAGYFGGSLQGHSLLPGPAAHVGSLRLSEWLAAG